MSAHRIEAQRPGLLYSEDSPLHPGHAEISMNFWKEMELFTKALSKPSSPFNSQRQEVNSSHYQLSEQRGTKLVGHRPRWPDSLWLGKAKAMENPLHPLRFHPLSEKWPGDAHPLHHPKSYRTELSLPKALMGPTVSPVSFQEQLLPSAPQQAACHCIFTAKVNAGSIPG